MSTAVTEEHQYAPVYAPARAQGADAGSRGGQQQGAVSAAPTAEVTTRFLGFLVPAAITALETVGAAAAEKAGEVAISALSDMFRGRSMRPAGPSGYVTDGFVQPVPDLTGPLVQQCSLDCLFKIAEPLADVIKNWYDQTPSLADESRSIEASVAKTEAVERFWPEISSFITQQVAEHLPDIMQTANSVIQPLLGKRDAAQTPQLTGTEAHARWFLPVLETVLTAVQQELPELIGVLSGSRASRDTGITWTDLKNYGRFWDNDFILVVDKEDLPDQNSVKLVLELAPHLSWTKEIQVLDNNGTEIARLRVHDAVKRDEATVRADQILNSGSLVFAKAKTQGIVSSMYILPTSGLHELSGAATHIRWMSD